MEQGILIEKDGPIEGEQERSQNLFSDIPSLLQSPFIRSSLHSRGGTVQGPEYEEVGIIGTNLEVAYHIADVFKLLKISLNIARVRRNRQIHYYTYRLQHCRKLIDQTGRNHYKYI